MFNIFSLTAIVLSSLGAPTEPPKIPATIVTTPPVIDGVVDTDKEWPKDPSITGLFQYNTGTPEVQPTKLWLAYDPKFIYIAGQVAQDPSTIIANERKTNSSLTGDDLVSFVLDLSGNYSEVNSFSINPLGTTSTQLAGGRANKLEWAGQFIAKARITSSGWEFEARIPWALIHLPHKTEKKNLKIDFQRNYIKAGKYYAANWNNQNYVASFPIWTDVAIPSAPVDHSIQLLPYGIVGYDKETKDIGNAGLDLKTKVSDGLTVVGTINPDFRNVESSVLSLDFSRLDRLASENRPFFQEGSRYITSLFASQLIQHIDSGIKVYGKVNENISLGVGNTTDFGNENDLGARIRFDDKNNRYLSLSVTNQTRPDYSNFVSALGFGAQDNKGRGYTFSGISTSDQVAGKGNSASFDLYKQDNGSFFDISYKRTTENYVAGLGFTPLTDVAGFNSNISFWGNPDKGAFRSYNYYASLTNYNRASSSEQHYFDLNGGFYVSLRNLVGLGYSMDQTRFFGDEDRTSSYSIIYPNNDTRRNFGISYTTGNIGGSPYKNLGLSASYWLFNRLSLTGTFQEVTLFGGKTTQEIFSFNYDLNKGQAIAGRVLRNGNDTNAYLSFRKAGVTGNEYYLILGDPSAQKTRTSLLLKMVIPLTIGR